MQRSHLKLLPGESIRTPRILLMFWQGDRLESQNLLRRFLLAHHSPLPKAAGRLPVFYGSWGELREKTQLDAIQWFVDNKIPIDVFWIDAGWYGDKPFRKARPTPTASGGNTPAAGGRTRSPIPRGLRPIGQAAPPQPPGLPPVDRSRSGCSAAPISSGSIPTGCWAHSGDNYLVNLGNPAARQGITDIVSALIDEGGIWPATARTSTPTRKASGTPPTRPTAGA